MKDKLKLQLTLGAPGLSVRSLTTVLFNCSISNIAWLNLFYGIFISYHQIKFGRLYHRAFGIQHSAFYVVPATSKSSSRFAVGLPEKPAIIIHFFVAISTEFKIEISLKFVSSGRKRR